MRDLDGIQIRTIREMNALCAAGAEEDLTATERDTATHEIEERLRCMVQWPIHKPGLDVRRIQALTCGKMSTLTRIRLG